MICRGAKATRKSRETLSRGESPAQPDKGWPPEAANFRRPVFIANESLPSCTEILRFAQNDGVRREGNPVTPAAKRNI